MSDCHGCGATVCTCPQFEALPTSKVDWAKSWEHANAEANRLREENETLEKEIESLRSWKTEAEKIARDWENLVHTHAQVVLDRVEWKQRAKSMYKQMTDYEVENETFLTIWLIFLRVHPEAVNWFDE